ncbi:MAG: GNAT family N-acetyltransferase [Acidobacteriota bacterium]|nr:MAG: GNAT family N-acetyltransferase [Acidobacteriota bacterium]
MERIGLNDLDTERDRFDAIVGRAGHLDRFCSSTAWILPAQAALMAPREPWIFRGEQGYVAMMRARHPAGFTYAESLEAAWGLACPLVGADGTEWMPKVGELFHRRQAEWDVLLVTGLIDASRVGEAFVEQFGTDHRIQRGETTPRYVASLADGLDGFLSRRSSNLRRSLSRASRRAASVGIELTWWDGSTPADADVALSRIRQIELGSWKGRQRLGLAEAPLWPFYRQMSHRLLAAGRLRILFARHEDRDVGYYLGGVFATTFRGLQCSYDAEYRRVGLGNLLQLEQVRRHAEEGYEQYDLGTGAGHYKKRWSDQLVTSTAILVIRSR